MIITGASSGIGRAAALKIAAAGGIPILVARSLDKLEEVKQEIESRGGTAYAYSADLSDNDAIDAAVEKILADHAAVDMLVNNAGRSIRRSVMLSTDRIHDYERTIKLNYLGTIKLILALLPHMKEQRFGHIVNVSSIGVQTNPPRFSAYVASKAALDAFTRVVSSETIGDNITFTTIHMPLVRTPMIAPTKIYDSFPTISPDEAADLICEAIRVQAEADQHAAGDVRRGALRAGAEGRRPDPAHGLQRLPRVRGRQRQEGRQRARLGRGRRPVAPDEGRALVIQLRAVAARRP